MNVWNIIAIAAGLGMDAMSVCIGIGVRWHGARQKFRMAWHMGLFQFIMPILGWLIGSQLAGLLSSVGSYVAAVLVFAIGVKMLYEALKKSPGAVEQAIEEKIEHALHVHPKDPTRGFSLIALSIATSLDALVVGISLGVRGEGSQIWTASAVIGVVAAAMALIGVVIGKRMGEVLGRPAEILGAVILMLIAVSFLAF